MMNKDLNFFHRASSEEESLYLWERSQYDLIDIVLFLTDNRIKLGVKFYSLFSRIEIKNLMRFYWCDFVKIKNILGIDEYVVRGGDIYAADYNPKRNKINLNFSQKLLLIKAKKIYSDLLIDLHTISLNNF